MNDAKTLIQSATNKTRLMMAFVSILALVPGLALASNAILQWDPLNTSLRILSAIFGLVFIATAVALLRVASQPSPITTLLFDEPGKILRVTTENIRYRGIPSNRVNLYLWTSDTKRHVLLTDKATVQVLLKIIHDHAPHAKIN
jgi:hypothetical protein